MSAIPGIVWEADGHTYRNTFVSIRARDLLGYEPEEWLAADDFWELHLHPEDAAASMATVEHAIETMGRVALEYRFRTAEGSYRWIRDTIEVIPDAEGYPHLVGVMIDTTDEHSAREGLAIVEEDRDLLARAVEQSGDSIFVTDMADRILYVNAAFERMTGYPRAEVLGRQPAILMSDETPPSVYRDLQDGVRARIGFAGELTSRRKDGTTFRERVSIVPVKDARGRIVNFVGISRDVTRELELESQLARAAKMEAVGQLAAGVAHDFNNILTAIIGHASLAASAVPADNASRKDLAGIVQAGERAQRLVAQLLAFGRRSLLQPAVLDVGALLHDVEPMLVPLLGEDIRLGVESSGPALAYVDPGQLQNAVVNLVVNARNAMPRGGSLRLTAGTALVSSNGGAADRWVVLRVRDTGHGIAPEMLDRIFEPFFTTDEFGRGTGMGLAMVDGFVRQSGGRVEVESTPDVGTTFTIWLPSADHARTGSLAADALPAGPGGGLEAVGPAGEPSGAAAAVVLVVEDEGSIREVAQRMLVLSGYRVLVAASGEEALQVADAHPGPIDVLFTDVVMPGMGGPAVADALLATRPSMRVVLTSGYAEDDVTRRGIVVGEHRFLPKPYRLDDLVETLAEVLHGDPA